MTKGILFIWVRSFHNLSNCNVLTSGALRALLAHPLRVKLSYLRLVQSIEKVTFRRSLLQQRAAKQAQ